MNDKGVAHPKRSSYLLHHIGTAVIVLQYEYFTFLSIIMYLKLCRN